MCADSIFIRESKNGPSIRGSSCSSPESGKTAPWCEATEAPGNSVPYRSSLTKYSIGVFQATPTRCPAASLMLLLGDCDKSVVRIYARKCGCVLIFQGAIF